MHRSASRASRLVHADAPDRLSVPGSGVLLGTLYDLRDQKHKSVLIALLCHAGKDCTCILHHASAHVVTLPAALPPTLTALDTHLFQPSRPTGSKQLQLGHHSHGRAGGPADEVGDARGSSETLPNKLTSDLSRRRSGGASERPVHALCIELVGDRFLRKQVRVLVSTAVRAARLDHHMHGDGPLFDHPEADPWVSQAAEVDMPMQDAALEHYVSVGLNRASTAAPAPPQGLCFAGAGEETWPAS